MHTYAYGWNTITITTHTPISAASISVRNVRNLPKGNLTVKPDPSDAQNPLHQQLQQQQHLTQGNYDQTLGKLTNSYYGTAHDTKYAKTTTLTDHRSGGGAGASVGVGFYSSSNGLNSGSSSNILASSTPLHPGVNGGDYYGGISAGVGGGAAAGPTLWQEQHIQQQASYPMRRVDSRAEIDMLKRETSTQMRVSRMSGCGVMGVACHFWVGILSNIYYIRRVYICNIKIAIILLTYLINLIRFINISV